MMIKWKWFASTKVGSDVPHTPNKLSLSFSPLLPSRLEPVSCVFQGVENSGKKALVLAQNPKESVVFLSCGPRDLPYPYPIPGIGSKPINMTEALSIVRSRFIL